MSAKEFLLCQILDVQNVAGTVRPTRDSPDTCEPIQAKSHIAVMSVEKVFPSRLIYSNTSEPIQVKSHIAVMSVEKILPIRLV